MISGNGESLSFAVALTGGYMPLADPGTANDAAHLQQLHQQAAANRESPSAEMLSGERHRTPSMDAIADQLALDIDRAPTKHLDYLARELWKAHAAGALDDDTAQGLAELLRDRQ